jgi:hypothetical protein
MIILMRYYEHRKTSALAMSRALTAQKFTAFGRRKCPSKSSVICGCFSLNVCAPCLYTAVVCLVCRFEDDGVSVADDEKAMADETVAKYNSIMGIKTAGEDDDDDVGAAPGRSEG